MLGVSRKKIGQFYGEGMAKLAEIIDPDDFKF